MTIPTTTRRITSNISEYTVKRNRTIVLIVANNLDIMNNESDITTISCVQTELKLNRKMSKRHELLALLLSYLVILIMTVKHDLN